MAKSKKVQETPDRQHYNVWGYSGIPEVAEDIQGGIHSSLLEGYYVFGYRGRGDILRLVITRRDQDTWMYGMVTTGWTCLIPRTTKENLLSMVIPDLEAKKINKDIIEDLKFYVEQ